MPWPRIKPHDAEEEEDVETEDRIKDQETEYVDQLGRQNANGKFGSTCNEQ